MCQYLKTPNAEQASAYLWDLVAELMGSFHGYRFSIEAVLKFISAVETSSTARFHPLTVAETADQYGPIRDPESFSAPHDDAVHEMIERRFAPWLKAVQ
tara:strand:+ start:99 stop:395 length:297 start_codon:yes stop_codon:yes gene_type:complete